DVALGEDQRGRGRQPDQREERLLVEQQPRPEGDDGEHAGPGRRGQGEPRAPRDECHGGQVADGHAHPRVPAEGARPATSTTATTRCSATSTARAAVLVAPSGPSSDTAPTATAIPVQTRRGRRRNRSNSASSAQAADAAARLATATAPAPTCWTVAPVRTDRSTPATTTASHHTTSAAAVAATTVTPRRTAVPPVARRGPVFCVDMGPAPLIGAGRTVRPAPPASPRRCKTRIGRAARPPPTLVGGGPSPGGRRRRPRGAYPFRVTDLFPDGS